MKNLLFAFVLAPLLFACGGDQEIEIGQKTSLEIDPVFDAGEVQKGEVITAKFQISNTGDYPLVIADVKGSCSCTVAEYPEAPLQPGESGEILAHVNTDKTGTGIINKAVRVVANTNPSVTQVIVKAKVKSK